MKTPVKEFIHRICPQNSFCGDLLSSSPQSFLAKQDIMK